MENPNKDNLISVKQKDYLEEDKPIRGQNFVCLSFISPENVIDNKNVYFFNEFIKDFSTKLNELFDNLKLKYGEESTHMDTLKDYYEYLFDQKMLQAQYKYFIDENSSSLERDYLEKNNFQTSIRGVKVRGTYDSMREAEVRAEVLKRTDPSHNLFIGQVGCWVPFDPSPETIENKEYGETQLNTLMKGYNDNEVARDAHFEDRKKEMMERKVKHADNKETVEILEGHVESKGIDEIENEIIETDPWMRNKMSQSKTTETENVGEHNVELDE